VTLPERRVLVVEDGAMQKLGDLIVHLREHDFYPLALTAVAEARDLISSGYRLDAAVISLRSSSESPTTASTARRDSTVSCSRDPRWSAFGTGRATAPEHLSERAVGEHDERLRGRNA
jgi:hypothetical protein